VYPVRVLRDRLRALTRRARVVADIDEELRHHEDRLAERLAAEGLTPDEARRQARRRLGNAVALREAAYDVRGGGLVEAFFQDVRYGLRLLRRSPAFTAAALATLAVGIGANTAIFSVASGVLLRPLPYPSADRLAMVWMDNARISLREDWHSFPNYADYRAQNTTFEDVAIFNRTARTLTGEGDPDRLSGAYSSANLFDVLGVRPAQGRAYTAAEDRPGANDVVLIADGLWQRRFGGREDIVGRTIQMSGRSLRVVGVMPEDFAFPTRETEFWVPTAAPDDLRTDRGSLWLQVIGRLKPGVSVAQAQADLERVNAGILERFPQQKGYGVYVAGYRDQLVGRVRPAILVLAGAVGFVLLISCTNVANLLLARASARDRELALRAAIGAGRGRIVRQLVAESVLLGAAGGAAGLGLAWLGLSALVGAAPADLPRLEAIGIDGRVLAFAAALSVGTGFLFGLAPALQLARTNPGDVLREGARTSGGFGRSLRRAFVVAEVALAVVLLVGAGLMLRSFDRVRQVDLGFRPDHVLTARITLWGDRYDEPARVVDFFRQVLARVEARRGVAGAAGVGTVFLSPTPYSMNFSIEGRPDFPFEQRVEVPVDAVTPAYFRVMGVPLRRGRTFDDRDTSTSTPVVIINETMARMFWIDEDPIGRRIKYGSLSSRSPWLEIVGVVADTRRTGYDAPVRPETYLPHAQAPDSAMMLVVRTTSEPEAMLAAVRAAVQSVDPGMAVHGGASLESLLGEMTAARRLNTLLLSVFAGVAVLLAAIGIYGVLAYSVEQRARELSVRIALGASAPRLLRLVLAEGLATSLAGLGIGLAGAALLSRSMSSLLYGVTPTDPATFAVTAGATSLVAIAASLPPALRALRVSPVDVLKRI